jgi:hypothetical protein
MELFFPAHMCIIPASVSVAAQAGKPIAEDTPPPRPWNAPARAEMALTRSLS